MKLRNKLSFRFYPFDSTSQVTQQQGAKYQEEMLPIKGYFFRFIEALEGFLV